MLCGVIRPPMTCTSAATTASSACRRVVPAQLSSGRPRRTGSLDTRGISATINRRRRHASRLTPLAVVTDPSLETTSTTRQSRRRKGTTTTLDDDGAFDLLERNKRIYDASSVLEWHSQRQTFPSATTSADGAAYPRDDAAAAAFSSTTSLADEFPPPPPTITYEEVAPYVELARLEQPLSKKNINFDNDDEVDKSKQQPEQRQRRKQRQGLALPVLVGWFGCRRSHLRKYAAMYLSPEVGQLYEVNSVDL
jgi:hypothetical protein